MPGIDLFPVEIVNNDLEISIWPGIRIVLLVQYDGLPVVEDQFVEHITVAADLRPHYEPGIIRPGFVSLKFLNTRCSIKRNLSTGEVGR